MLQDTISIRPPPAEMVTLASVARRLNRSSPTLVRWAKAGEFPRFVIVNGRRYVFEADVAQWLEAHRAAARAAA